MATPLLAACQPVRTPPVAKVGLIAPFEGPSRPLGYATLNAVRLRLNQWNDAGGVPRLELVALNDDSDPELAAQLVSQLARDPDLLFVLGPPQGHTALAAAPALIDSGIPALSLAPIPAAFAAGVTPFAGTDLSLAAVLDAHIPGGVPAWNDDAQPPVIWLGDPLTLAQRLQTEPDWAAAAGSVAAEEVIDAWAGAAANGLIWAGACPQSLPADFPAAYEALAGSPPTFASRLAYAAIDAALAQLGASPDRAQLASELAAIEPPPLCVFIREENSCCKLLSPTSP